MPKYSYAGTSIDGNAVEGVLKADSLSDLQIKLVNKGVIATQTRPAYSTVQQLIIKHLRASDITRTTRQLAILLKSKVSLVESLTLASEQIKDKMLRAVYDDIIQQVEAGKSLEKSYANYPQIFDELYASMIEAGELSGNLEFAFGKIADYREKSESLAKKVKSALAYPLVVVAVAVLVVMALVLYVIPVFSSMYENFGAELPALTQNVVSTSNFLRNTIWYWLSGALLLAVVSIILANSLRVNFIFQRIMLKIPYFGQLIIKIATARFSRTMGSLLTAGVDIIYALEVSAKSMTNSYSSSLLQLAGTKLMEGKSLTSVLEDTKFFPRTLLRMVASGEKTGQLGDMLTNAADFFEQETDAEITTLTTLIEPVVIIILGTFIAFILVAMYLPLFELVGTI